MSDEEHHFEAKGDAGASKTYPQQAGTIRQSGHIVIKGRPCKMEGSVDEESTKSDEEYDDLAMEDNHEDGDLFDDERPTDDAVMPSFGNRPSNGLNGEKYKRNLDLFIRSKRCSQSESSSWSHSTIMRKVPSSGKLRIKRCSQSESSSWSHSTIMTSPTIQEEMPR